MCSILSLCFVFGNLTGTGTTSNEILITTQQLWTDNILGVTGTS
ncbi:hypothetical protein GLYMA_15G172850v4 [Glycine max]|nr:hypothetical protein GLYMA_15G172850v4 [Glycine max]KAH1147638.1 hypothetical protein GYH30_042664 [Glycine max]